MSTSGSSSETKKMIVLMSSDGESFEIEEEVAANSQTLKHMIEDECADSPIPLPNVTSPILAKVVEYCKEHTQPPASSTSDHAAAAAISDEAAYRERVKIFDEGFVKDVSADQATLFDVLLAANYLNIKSLMDLMCQTTADMIRGKTAEEIRAKFNIKNDFTPEQEDQVRKDNAWAFE